MPLKPADKRQNSVIPEELSFMKQHSRFNKSLLSTCIAAVAFGSTSMIAHAQNDAGFIEEVVVTGTRSSLSRSVDVKRNAASVVDAISAEDIGKLPDTTIADSLQGVPGIQIRRTTREGSTVNVRGMGQVSTLLIGEQFLSAGSITSVQPELSDIPAELLSRVEVIKSSEAKTLAAGVSGTINLQTRRPLDMDEGWTFAGSAEGSQGSYTDDETGHKVTGFAGFNNGDTFGASLAVTNSKADMANYRYGMYTDWWFRGYNEVTDLTGDGDTNDHIFGTIDYGVTNKLTERERTGVAASFQFRPSDRVELLADIFYTKMDEENTVKGLIADNAWSDYDWVTPDQDYLVNRGSSAGNSDGKEFWTSNVVGLDATRVLAKSETQVEDRESLNVNLQANFEISDNFFASVRYLHGKAEHSHSGVFADALLTSGLQTGLVTVTDGVSAPVNPGGWGAVDGAPVPVTFNWSGEHPSMAWPSGFGQSMDEYGLVSYYSSANYDNEATLDVFRADGSYEFDNENYFTLDFGYRFADREVIRSQYDYISPFTAKDADGNEITAYTLYKDSGMEIAGAGSETIAQTYSFNELDSRGLITRMSDFGPASDGTNYYFIDTGAMTNAYGFIESLSDGNIKRQDGAQSYIVDEKSHTFHIQGSWEGEFVFPYQANFGVQYIKTELDVTQYESSSFANVGTIDGQEFPILTAVPADVIGTIHTSRDYEDWLPRLNVAFDTSDNTKLRFAYSKTMMQMDANNLGLGRKYYSDNMGTHFQVTSATENGNPNLEPWRSQNFDLSFEYYFADTNMVSAGLFYLDIEDSITTINTPIAALPDSDGVTRQNTINLQQISNTGGGELQGIELAYQQSFDFLPGAWSGLGTTINYTWTDGEGRDTDFYGATMPMGDNSEHQANAVLWYEYDQWQARIAYNYRSERYIGSSWNDGSPAAWWQAPTSYVDASVSYDINDNVSVYLQGTNITEEYEETYMQWSDVKVNQNIYEARYTLGVRAKF